MSMDRFEHILQRHWGFTHFRPLQKDIIESVCNGNDTLGLMPTGGGKSIVFQVAALSSPGLCIVVTPLIALMKDQVDNLWARQIKAVAIYSGMSQDEIQGAFDKCQWGDYRFLYVSPERLKTELFINRVRALKINLVVIDEAHCISRWGYDFRPSYLEIAKIRELLPGVTFLALTATATPEVIDDIMTNLHFKAKNVFSTSFERTNLTYLVRERDDKIPYLITIAQKSGGSGIVYVRNRNKTQEVAVTLARNGLKADFYHAGLSAKERTDKQAAWKKSHDSIMVCTNAFGMGIDKPDVRFVVHIDLPETPEDYFQEAGRAGRDGQPAFAVLLFNQSDVERLTRNVEASFPPTDSVKRVYEALAHYFQIPVGTNSGSFFEFNINDFCPKFQLNVLETYNSLKILEQEGYISLTDAFETQSKLKLLMDREQLYKFQVANRQFDPFIKLLLRSYTGLFSDYTRIDEQKLSTIAMLPTQQVKIYLQTLMKAGVLAYYPAKSTPMIEYLCERVANEYLSIDQNAYKERKNRQEKRALAMIHYATSTSKCRSLMLLEYFGQKNATRCGNCDLCRKRNELNMSTYEFDTVLNDVKQILKSGQYSSPDLIKMLKHSPESIAKVVQYLVENGKIIDKGGQFHWHQQA